MALFDPKNASRSAAHVRIHALFEIAYTAVDFTAALCFVVGSVMFFYADWQETGTWLFLVGSIAFAMKPTIRLARELRFLSLGKGDKLAEKLDD